MSTPKTRKRPRKNKTRKGGLGPLGIVGIVFGSIIVLGGIDKLISMYEKKAFGET